MAEQNNTSLTSNSANEEHESAAATKSPVHGESGQPPVAAGPIQHAAPGPGPPTTPHIVSGAVIVIGDSPPPGDATHQPPDAQPLVQAAPRPPPDGQQQLPSGPPHPPAPYQQYPPPGYPPQGYPPQSYHPQAYPPHGYPPQAYPPPGYPPGQPTFMVRCPRCQFVSGPPPYGPPYPPPQQQWPTPPYQPQTNAPPGQLIAPAPPPANNPNAPSYQPNAYLNPKPPQQPETKKPIAKNLHISPTSPPAPLPPPSTIRVASENVPGEHTDRPAGLGEEVILNADGSRIVRSKTLGPKGQRAKMQRLTRDERVEILLMRRLGYTKDVIAKFMGCGTSGVSYTINQGTPDTKHHLAGRKVVGMAKEPEAKMVAFVADYLAREKVCGIDKRSGRKTMRHLNYNKIRDALFRDKETGEIPKELKFTDDMMKATLNKHGLWLRQPFPKQKIEQARIRGKQQWLAKLEKDKKAAEKAAAEAEASGGVVRVVSSSTGEVGPGLAGPVRFVSAPKGYSGRATSIGSADDTMGYSEAEAEHAHNLDEDEEMQEVYSETDSGPDEEEEEDENEDEDEGGDDEDDMRVGQQLRHAIAAHPVHNGQRVA